MLGTPVITNEVRVVRAHSLAPLPLTITTMSSGARALLKPAGMQYLLRLAAAGAWGQRARSAALRRRRGGLAQSARRRGGFCGVNPRLPARGRATARAQLPASRAGLHRQAVGAHIRPAPPTSRPAWLRARRCRCSPARQSSQAARQGRHAQRDGHGTAAEAECETCGEGVAPGRGARGLTSATDHALRIAQNVLKKHLRRSRWKAVDLCWRFGLLLVWPPVYCLRYCELAVFYLKSTTMSLNVHIRLVTKVYSRLCSRYWRGRP